MADYIVVSKTMETTVMKLSARDQNLGKVVRVQKSQTTGMSVSTSALAVIVTSSIGNTPIDALALKVVMIRFPSSKPRDAEL
jgi:molybdopterin-binding protein